MMCDEHHGAKAEGGSMDQNTKDTDQPVLFHIEQLVQEEHKLYEAGERKPLGDTERQKLVKLQVELDRCWDLLRQRRALRELILTKQKCDRQKW